jgi:hypothetical protein
LEPNLVNSFKVIRVAGKDFEILSLEAKTWQFAQKVEGKFENRPLCKKSARKLLSELIVAKNLKNFSLHARREWRYTPALLSF